jgi:membrane associated rhomboid family serine protease
VPLSDRDYMRTPPPSRGYRRAGSSWGLGLSPLWLIIIANFIVFIAVLVSGEGRYPFSDHYWIISDKLTYYLGLIPYYFFSRPWTIITAMFIHAGFWHLFVNMFTLFFFGRALAMLVGHNRFLLVYFIGGIFGNVMYLLLGNDLSIAVGASGAVYAIAGALVMLRPNIRVLLYFFIPMPLWLVVLIFFVLFSLPPIADGLNMAWQAHLGGLVVGLIAGYFFRKRLRYIYY